VEEKPFSLALAADGDLQRSELNLRAREAPFELTVQAVLQAFSEPQLAAFSARARDLNLATLLAELPQTRINASCSMAQKEAAASSGQANCRLDNALAGPLDQGRLPVTQITARLGESEGKLILSALRLGIGTGSLQGRAEWSAAGLHADLNAQALDLAAIHSRAQRSRLAGPLVFARDADGMKLGLNLREDKLSIQAQLFGDDRTFTLERLQLNARGASFAAEGRVQKASGEFSLHGKFDRFDARTCR
jgi:autotransporter translocation and assembly factor TamB